MDLQAKAYVLNMTMFIGEYGCLSCEEPGRTVKQGKGHTCCYPYRPRAERKPYRDSYDVIQNKGALASNSAKPIFGIKGVSKLTCMPWFNLVLGTVPDYMHGILLGVTKTLLNKWFSPSNCGKQ